MTDTPSRPGTTSPDHRGRTGLHLTGRDLDRNPRVRVDDVDLLAAGWHVLRATTFRYRGDDGTWTTQTRETYDRGNGATILLYDPVRRTVLLTRQFRYPVYVNDHPDGMLIETAAGLLDDDDPVTAIRREAEEETGVRVDEVQHVFDAYMSPGSVTERLHFFSAAYDGSAGVGERGGLAEEDEEIEILEYPVDEAVAMIRDGSIQDAKTIMLLQWAVLDGPFARG
ncbi:NUDIX domain-containing protein [Microbacterium sp.]|uniref:NUDIX domain-containing protein n=1 Tax=Microbacterium sp. TaxID=51671 RepID=UPI00391C8FE7